MFFKKLPNRIPLESTKSQLFVEIAIDNKIHCSNSSCKSIKYGSICLISDHSLIDGKIGMGLEVLQSFMRIGKRLAKLEKLNDETC